MGCEHWEDERSSLSLGLESLFLKVRFEGLWAPPTSLHLNK